jgi:hypothetical protein
MSPDQQSTLDVAAAFEKVGVAYYLCGSMASSALGLPRASADVDFVADLMPYNWSKWVAALGANFACDEEMIREAVDRRSSFNIFDLRSAFKIDVFVAGFEKWDREQLKRVRRGALTRQSDAQVALPTAEDTVLAKLAWYRKGGEVSDRQWSDILGVLKVQAASLDVAYLERWAGALRVSDLLERALKAAATD